MADRPAVRGPGRPPERQEAVREELLARIRAGTWGPGCRLPPRLDLVRDLGTTSTTLQAALDDLRADGVITTRGPQGTFVADRPPFLHRFGLLLPHAPEVGPENRFWSALRACAQHPPAGADWTMEVYYGRHWQAESPSYLRLVEDCQRGLLAGLIIALPERMIAGSPIMACPDLVRYHISGTEALAGCDPRRDRRIRIRSDSFRRLAIGRMAAERRRRVAVLAGSGAFNHTDETSQRWIAGLADAGIASRPAWTLGLDLVFPRSAINQVALLFDRPPEDRPDGLVIADDNLVPAVLEGLAQLGLVPGRDLGVVAYANLPLDGGPRPGVVHAGLDIPALLARMVHATRDPGGLGDLAVETDVVA